MFTPKHKLEKLTKKLKLGNTLNLATAVHNTVNNSELIYFKKKVFPLNLIDLLTTSTWSLDFF